MPFDNRVFFVCKNIPDVRRQLLKASNYKEEMYFNNKAEEVALFLYPFEMDLLDQIQELYHGIPAFKETLKSNFNLFQRTEVDPFLSQDSLFMRLFILTHSQNSCWIAVWRRILFWVWRRALYGGLSKRNRITERYGNPCEIS